MNSLLERLSNPTVANRLHSRGFKGLKQAVKLEYKLGKYDQVTNDQKRFRVISLMCLGYRPLHRAPDICQICGHTKLLREVYQQYARLY